MSAVYPSTDNLITRADNGFRELLLHKVVASLAFLNGNFDNLPARDTTGGSYRKSDFSGSTEDPSGVTSANRLLILHGRVVLASTTLSPSHGGHADVKFLLDTHRCHIFCRCVSKPGLGWSIANTGGEEGIP
jgi:hypothetical protein